MKTSFQFISILLCFVLSAVTFVTTAQDGLGIQYVCGNTYEFSAVDPQNWIIIPQDRHEYIFPENGMTIESAGGLIVWHEFSYEFVYGDTPCEDTEPTAQEIGMISYVQNLNLSLEELFDVARVARTE